MRSMGKLLAITSALSVATLLSACGGDSAPQTVGSVAPPTGGTPTPTHSFETPTETKTYDAIGVVQNYQYNTRSDGNGQSGQLYAGDANTARNGGITVTYNPRDAIFELTINRPLGNVSVPAFRFQDPAHRTNFGGALEPQAGVPQLATSKNIQYLEAGSSTGARLSAGSTYYNSGAAQSDYPVGSAGYSSTTQTLFYQKPGTTTKYVTYAGFVRNTVSATEQQDSSTSPMYLRQTYSLDRAAFVFGERTSNSAVPTTGSGTYTGEMIATVAFNPALDTDPSAPTYFQWIEGSHTTNVNFATLGVVSNFTGTVKAPALDAYTSGAFYLPAGSTFTATAGATIDLVNKGGFTGNFSVARFVRPGLPDFVIVIAGSSMDGAFFGPNGQELGGGFRIVGGTPDERIDILGAFTGKK
ncbi:transferrin-binding protein-like solute binding protein [Sphingomonas sp. AOB5]|uniref:transferrin-binding protein-like solute binding protein n=1 Tax=Sphingomonas sp. AOB5 TaxID=3034017 RepID=UPI0023F65B8E|nr:transferrin-binding protein-like solute binding protein [Sphingomonas sp. AOB5]MDF7775677.1 transferrin-binding protein-like solute binding protein [Sphingomonas sp. AOB5]